MTRRGRDSTARSSLRGRALISGTALCLSVSAALLIGMHLLFCKEQEASHSVATTLNALNAAAAIETDIATLTSEARGYFVDRNASLLGSFDNAVRRVTSEVAELRDLANSVSPQQETIGRLERLITARVADLRGMIEHTRVSDDGSSAPAIVDADASRPQTQGILDELGAIKSAERRLLDANTRSAAEAARWMFLVIAATGVLAAAAGGSAVWLLFARQRRRDHLAMMQRLNGDLEQRMNERTRELAAIEAREKAYLSHLADGVVTIRVEPCGHLVHQDANAAAREMLGFPEELAGRSCYEVWPEDLAREIVANLSKCVRERRPVRYNTVVATSAGQRQFRSVVAPVFGPPDADCPQGPVVLLLSSVRDVTHEALLETQLRQAQRLEAVGRLSAGMAHDFNNLLQAQMGSLELLEDAIDVGDANIARDLVATALRLGERGAVLTHHLLSFSSKQVLRPCPVDPARSLPETAAMLASTLGPNIRVTVEVDPMTGSALADPNLLETAVLNLAFNARDAMPEGGQLRLQAYPATLDAAGASAASAATPGRYVVFAVSDEGSGMAPETLERAMEPFFTTKAAHGSGLGLAMVQSFALQSLGDMRIQSELGRGTRIELWLPASDTDATASGAAPNASLMQSGRRALVVDDVSDVLVAVSAFLQAAGFDVTQAMTGDLALEILDSGQQFDLLVSDYTMPGMTGAELVAHARNRSPGLAALMVTGHSEQFATEQLANVRVLSKPFRRNDFLQAVDAVMQAQSRVQPSIAADR